jgi:hypothetical protein
MTTGSTQASDDDSGPFSGFFGTFSGRARWVAGRCNGYCGKQE